MKLHLSMLEKMIDLPSADTQEIRRLLDDVGLEVKGMEGSGSATVYNIETLANRGDHLSAYGVARELSARLLTAAKPPAVLASFDDRKTSIGIKKNTKLCGRYALLEMTLPKGMQSRADVVAVMGAADPTRHPIVEILNYLQLELGQPMHAFDRDKVDGEVIIDLSEKEEQIVALDGKTYKVPPKTILIRDRKKIIAVAGIIGCQNSMVTPDTTRVLIESAAFDPVSVRISKRAMGIATDAAYIFERGSDVDNCLFALKRLGHLLGGAGGAVKDSNGAQIVGLAYVEGEPTEKRKVQFSIEQIRAEMNLPRLADVEITSRLKHLGYSIEATGEELVFKATVPSWRLWDVRTPEDIIEDVARALSYSRVKLELPALDFDPPEPEPIETLISQLEPALHGVGFFEVITKGFYSAESVKILEELSPAIEGTHVRIRNAIDGAYSHMKVTNILHLARLCEQNRRYGVRTNKVYEIGRLFSREPRVGEPYEYEQDTLTMASLGRWNDSEWRKTEPLTDQLQSFKGAIQALGLAAGVRFVVTASEEPLLHPGMQGALKVGRTTIGSFGVMHPLIAERLDINGKLLYAQIDLFAFQKVARERQYASVSDFPSVWRDVTVKIPERSLAGDAARWMSDGDPAHLKRVDIVDNFKRDGETFRRVTYRLVFQSTERTLESAEVDAAMAAILATLKERHSIEMIS